MLNLLKSVGILFGSIGMFIGFIITLGISLYVTYLFAIVGTIGGIIYLIKTSLDATEGDTKCQNKTTITSEEKRKQFRKEWEKKWN